MEKETRERFLVTRTPLGMMIGVVLSERWLLLLLGMTARLSHFPRVGAVGTAIPLLV
jgi:hypothetical protein